MGPAERATTGSPTAVQIGVRYQDSDTAEINKLTEQVVSTLAEDTGVLRPDMTLVGVVRPWRRLA